MKLLSIFMSVILGCAAATAATVFPASTNGNNVFTGTNDFTHHILGPSIVNSNVDYVAMWGSDATTIRGRVDLPSSTVTNALTIAKAGDLISVQSGTYYLSNWAMLGSGCTLRGTAPEYTTLIGPGGVGIGSIQITSDAVLENIMSVGTNTQPPVYINGGTNVTCRNVQTLGDWDGFIIHGSVGNMLFDDCRALSYFDCFQTQNSGTQTLNNCTFRAVYNSSFPHAVHGLVVGISGTPTVYANNCFFSAENGQAGSAAVQVQGGTLFLNNCTLNENHSGGTGAKLVVSGGNGHNLRREHRA